MQTIRTPKLVGSQQAIKYYAAFSEAFVEDILCSLPLKAGGTILDPWNGSGTTTCVAHRLGFHTIGYDLNPAVLMLAQARLATLDEVTQAETLLKKHFDATVKKRCTVPLPLLHDWFLPQSVKVLEALKASIMAAQYPPTLQALIDTSFTTALRQALHAFRSSNPTWIKKAKTPEELVALDKPCFKDHCFNFLSQLKKSLSTRESTHPKASAILKCANSHTLPLDHESVDAIITSPPYCTRIDYAIATRVELAWLGLSEEALTHLRTHLIGTPTVKGALLSVPTMPNAVHELLETIKHHPSKASSGYYYKTYLRFFISMQHSFKELHRVLKPKGSLCLVVQNSFYKEIPIDLSKLFQAMLEQEGFELLNTPLTYPAKGLNFIHGHKTLEEVALTCRKTEVS
ncbi:MAG: DNA methyltransferase [Vampirovibrionales bacterium]